MFAATHAASRSGQSGNLAGFARFAIYRFLMLLRSATPISTVALPPPGDAPVLRLSPFAAAIVAAALLSAGS
jgi:hypothetical protein